MDGRPSTALGSDVCQKLQTKKNTGRYFFDRETDGSGRCRGLNRRVKTEDIGGVGVPSVRPGTKVCLHCKCDADKSVPGHLRACPE